MSSYASLFTDASTELTGDESATKSASPYRILLVDDEENVLKALRRVFRQENYEIVTALNGNEALTALREAPCQLMISEYIIIINSITDGLF